jgi:DNA-binding transcriptional regulator YiaG
MSVVYFIQAGADGPIKIGVASNLRRRLQMLQTGCPVPLVVLAITDGGREKEAELHLAHRADLVRGEWFKPSPAVLASVEAARPPEAHRRRTKRTLTALAERRMALGLSQGELAATLGITQTVVSRCENAAKPNRRYDLALEAIELRMRAAKAAA